MKGEATIWMDKSNLLGKDLGEDILLYALSNLPLKGEATIRMDKSYPLGEDLGGALSPFYFLLFI